MKHKIISERKMRTMQIERQIGNEQRYLQNKARIYILKCFVELDCFVRFVKNSRHYDEVAEFLGFYHICDSEDKFSDSDDKEKIKKEILIFCKKELDSLLAKEKRGRLGSYKIMSDNLAMLKQTLRLNETDLAILVATITIKEVPIFDEFLSDIYDRHTSSREICFTIAKMIGCEYSTVAYALNANSVLKKMSILEHRRYDSSINNTLSFDNNDLADALLVAHNDNNSFVGHFVIPCDKSTLDSSDYAHIKEIDSLICYLRFAKNSRKKGVNILLYGTPGTGKTEFTKILAQNIGANLYKVRVDNNEGEAEDGIERISSYLLAQRFLDASKDILLYDEVEDVLNCEKGRFKNKAFFNEALENNPVPTIWITNKIYDVDSAVVRRFDFVIAMNAPKKSVRKAMLEKICGEKLDKKTLKLAQKSPNLAPALINRANEISSVLQGNFSKNFLMLLNNTLKAQGHAPIKKSKKSKDSAINLPKSYSVDFINADCDLSGVASGLSANPNARICLYGLSGTGKSAYAQFIAKSLKRPCIIKAVSDLESMWVGETEKNIARAFKEAKEKKAVLVFDEVDSFLHDRKLAVRSWEATKVNEMLLQMEKFNGIFIATTNLMDNIDKAALRRFDLKVEFKALNETQRVNLFKKECTLLGLKCESNARDLVARLDLLTPGDFAAVKRQNKFSPIKNAKDFYVRLCDEVKVKDLREDGSFGANGGVGFLR